jgi:two-component system, NarL family, sensor histidine kinase BarA
MFHVSLAAKCRLLFGLAVVLIIAAALFVPWYALETVVQYRTQERAENLAVLAHARLDPSSRDWVQQQALLDQWLRDYAGRLGLPKVQPKLILLRPGGVDLSSSLALDRMGAWLGRANRVFRRALPALPFPIEVGVTAALWQLLPAPVREEIASDAQHIAAHLAEVVEPAFPHLDKFQRECAEKMGEKDGPNRMSRPERVPGQPNAYRFVLAVRGQEAGFTGKSPPLIGLIDVRLPLKDAEESLLYVRLLIVLAGLLAGFLAILVFYLITQKLILAPVRELKACAERVADGDMAVRSTIETGDEFGELSAAFNTMLTQLERSRVELETINRSLDTRLGELAETNVALYESNRVKSEFLANVSHELRTPLTSIIGFADLLRDMTQDDSSIDTTRAARYANNILTSGRMLLDIINDLLDLAKIEAGKVELHRSTFSLTDVCEGLGDFIRPLSDKKGLTLSLVLSDQLPLMNSDSGKIRQVLYNLLSNAIKYTPDGGTVQLNARPLEDSRRVRMDVIDTGPGISSEQQQQIFEKFRQLDSSVTREHSGTGLGLAISKELCGMLGGTIRLESEVGKGSRFIVELPTECPESARRPLPSLT